LVKLHELLDAVCEDNIQLPLDVYKLWTLPGFSEALSEKQKLCDVAPTAFAPGEFQPDLEYLKVMAGPETLIRPAFGFGNWDDRDVLSMIFFWLS